MLLCSLSTSIAWCQADFPTKTIKLIVPFPAGGGTDAVARIVTQKMGELFNESIIVENKIGAGGSVATEFVARAQPDGYTLLFTTSGHSIQPNLQKLSWHPIKDFYPISTLVTNPLVLAVRSDFESDSIKDLIIRAKEHPGKLTYGSGGIGTLQHVWGAILTSSLGLDMLHIPFKGASPAHQEMMGGRLDVMFDNMSASKQYVQSGRLKGLVVSSAARSPQLPNVPTVNESGLVKFEGESWFGIFAPAGTPAPVVAKLREALASINAQPEFSAKVERDGGRMLNIPAAQQQNYLRDEIDRWVGAVNRYNVTAE